MHTCDVLIVGGGPGGSSCAARLVDAGLDVLLVDRARFPRDKVCAGWITPAVVRALRLDLHDYAQTRTLQPFTGFWTGSVSGSLRRTAFDEVVSYGIRRCEFDDYLLTRSGVRVETHDVREIRRDGSAWVVDDRIRARMLVGAGGHFCPVARALNADVADNTPVLAQEVEFELDPEHAASCPVSSTEPELFFWPDWGGYAWCVRKGTFLNVGAGRLAPAPLLKAVHEFTAVLHKRGGVLPRQSLTWKGHAYLLNRTSRRRLYGDGFLLIGDSAGLALAPSGEGILTAVESGVLAADVILSVGAHRSAAQLSWYAHDVATRFGPRAAAMTAPTSMPAWLTTTASSLALAMPWIRRHVLLEDWFLHRGRPELSLAFSAPTSSRLRA
jgi:flavin-dependent dehydrogenase